MPFRPTLSTGHLDMQLTRVSQAYMNSATAFAVPRAFPVINVNDKTGKYLQYSKEDFLGNNAQVRPLGGEPVRVDLDVTRADYATEEYAVAGVLDDRERANATPPYDPEEAKIVQLTQQMLIQREVLWASTYFALSKGWTDRVGQTATPSEQDFVQWDQAAGNPVTDIRDDRTAVLLATGVLPNILICGREAWDGLKENAAVLAKYSVGQGGVQGLLTQQLVAGVLDLDEIIVSDSIRNTAVQGATVSTAFNVSTKDALLCYRPAAPGLFQLSSGYTFAWTGLLGGNAFNTVGVWRERDGKAFSDWFAVRSAYGFGIGATDTGTFYSAAVA